VFGRRRRRLAEVTRTTVVLHLGAPPESIAGILLEEYDDVVAIVQARLLSESTGRALPLDGEVLVPRARIRFAQVGITIDDTRPLALAPLEGSRGAA
jgi:hypothetical protein